MLTLAFLHSLNQSIQHALAGLDWPMEGFVRLLLAAFCGGMAGLERQVRGRQAGFRTYLLVAMGSALVMVVSINFALHQWASQTSHNVNINVDPGRIAYGVMTGIGFLCAGVIIQQKGAIRGLTTAASLWCVAAVGLAAGFGMYLTALFATLIIVTALWLLDYLEDVIPRQRHRTVVVRVKWSPGCISDAVGHFKKNGFHIEDAHFKRSDDLSHADIDLRISFRNAKQYFSFERKLTEDNHYHLMATREL